MGSLAAGPNFDVIRLLLAWDESLLRSTDKFGYTPLDYVKPAQYAAWTAFLTEQADNWWHPSDAPGTSPQQWAERLWSPSSPFYIPPGPQLVATLMPALVGVTGGGGAAAVAPASDTVTARAHVSGSSDTGDQLQALSVTFASGSDAGRPRRGRKGTDAAHGADLPSEAAESESSPTSGSSSPSTAASNGSTASSVITRKGSTASLYLSSTPIVLSARSEGSTGGKEGVRGRTGSSASGASSSAHGTSPGPGPGPDAAPSIRTEAPPGHGRSPRRASPPGAGRGRKASEGGAGSNKRQRE